MSYQHSAVQNYKIKPANIFFENVPELKYL